MALSKKDREELDEFLRKQAELQAKINSSGKEYLEVIKEIKNLQKDIAHMKAEEAKLQKKASDAAKAFNDEYARIKSLGKAATRQELQYLLALRKTKDVEEAKLDIIQGQVKAKEKVVKLMAEEAKQASKLAAIGASTLKTYNDVSNTLKTGVSWLERWNLIKMDKAPREAALQMGIIGSRTKDFTASIRAAGDYAANLGISVEQIAKMQSDYSEALGRNVILSQQGLDAMSQMAASTSLGAEGASRLAADMNSIGFNAEATRDYVQQTMNDASKMGVNASKVIKTISGNIKLLNKYNFKRGAEGLSTMALRADKLGHSIEAAASLAEKVMSVEGAVETAAQLQVLGGEWAKLADPFKLLYGATSDIEGLNKALEEATKNSASWNETTKQYDIAPVEMLRLREVAKATNQDLGDLVETAKRLAQQADIRKEISINADIDDETKAYIEAQAEMGKDRKATIMVGMNKVAISALNKNDLAMLKTQAQETEALEDRKKNSQMFLDKWNVILDKFYLALYPLLDQLDENLIKPLGNFIKSEDFKGFLTGVKTVAKTVGSIIGALGSFAVDHPWLSIIGGALTKTMFDVGVWALNGVALGTGFLSVTKGLSGIAGAAGGLAKGLGPAAAGVGGYLAGGEISKSLGNEDTLSGDIGSAIGGVVLGGLGSFLGLGPVGAMAGAAIGSAIGKSVGDWIGTDNKTQSNITPMNDGIIFNKNDKFLSMKDGLIAGTNVNGNKDLAKAIGGGSSNVKHEFGELRINGSIELKGPNGMSTNLDINELLKNQEFRTSIASMVGTEFKRIPNMGKVQPKYA